jgi:hypothetical protein
VVREIQKETSNKTSHQTYREHNSRQGSATGTEKETVEIEEIPYQEVQNPVYEKEDLT